jgi:hypothetical protein
MKRLLILCSAVLLLAAPLFAQGTPGPTPAGAVVTVQPVERADAATNVQHSHSTGATLTLTAGPAGSSTQSIYITGLDVTNCQGSAVTAAAPTYITTTGLNGSPQYMTGSGPAAAGTCSPASVISFSAPLKSSSPGTNVTFVLPAFVTNQVISLNVYYRLGW